MNISIRYYTRSGNTEKLANSIGQAIEVQARSVTEPLEEKADILFLGCSYYGFDVDEAVKEFIQHNKDNIGKIICFGTSAMMKSILKPVRKVTEKAGVALSDEEFHCRGSFGPAHKGRPNQQDLKNAADFVVKIIDKSR